ncbi:sensor histidine kinase [Paenibacillus sp. P25]|nr:sensor histidine kinase [Paenibacillus sp. P25]
MNMIFRRFFKQYRFTSKLMITYLLLTVVPMALLGYFSYVRYTGSIESQVGKYVPRILSQAGGNIDRKLDELQNLSELIYNSNEVVSILRRDSGPSLSQSRLRQDQYTVESYLSRTYLSGNYSDVLGVFVLSKNRVFQNAKRTYRDFDPGAFANVQDATDAYARGKMSIILPYDSSLRFEGNVPYLLIVKPIKDFDNRKSLGTMIIAVTLTFIQDVLAELAESDSGESWIMDGGGKIVYHTDPEQIGGRYPDARRFPVTYGSFKRTDAADGGLFSVSTSAFTGWMLVHRIPAKELTGPADRVRNATIAAFILFAAVTGAISVLLAWNFTRPLNQLRRLMADVQKGNFEVDMRIRSRDDEIGMLAHRFNSMVREIRELIREKYQIELRQKEAELYALQFQINPHFMYNTLETISMAVEEGEREQVVEMVFLLGRMLRFSLGNKRRIVAIAEELQHVEDFLRIQKFRFEDTLEYDVRTSVDTEKYGTPKFILRPIVENSIKYGLEHRQKVRIDIGIEQVERDGHQTGAIRFTVRDNGVGMNAAKLEQVRRILQDSPGTPRDSGFGLVNVHSRIAMKFGVPYGLSIDSEEGAGTVTVLEIPLLAMGVSE